MIYRLFFKRLIDIVVSLSLLILSSPILLVVMIIMSFKTKGSIFFFQKRPGLNEKVFEVIKLKTMTDEVDEYGNLLPDEQRLTNLGKFIRSTSIDELPQLINVLKGDMSLIGPRPLLVKYLPLYNDFQKRRHEVKPGVTGWAQVNGRNTINWKKKFELDVYYVDHLSFLLDCKIILLTIKKVLFRENINSETTATAETFTGNN